MTKNMKNAKNMELEYSFGKTGIKAPHFVFYVKDLLAEKYGSKKVYEGGLKITTSLDLTIQEYAETAVASEMAKLQKMKVSNGQLW
jgi:membrane carboxypeptidase/penicillin-binding protein